MRTPGMLPLRYRENRAGMSFRWVRSPLAPKITSVRGLRLARQSQACEQRIFLHSKKWYIICPMQTSRGHWGANALARGSPST